MIDLRLLQRFSSIEASETEPFKDYLAKQIDSFIEIARQIVLDNEITDVPKIVEQLNEARTSIIDTVDYSLKGRRLLALMTLLKYVSKHMPPLCHEEINSSFFRMRVFDDKRNRERKELFHIPFSKQGKVKTQRYSLPGLPCLYLGKSLYGCWEELGRPPLYSCMFSRLSNTEIIKLWDLRIPEEIESIDGLCKFLLTVPLIIACSIKVAHPNDNYKPEYIIPQMLLEILSCGDEINRIYGKRPQNIIGIKYRSVLTNDDFKFPVSKNDNIVIPAVREKKEYDEKLCKLFLITQPTCEEFERIRYRELVLNGIDTSLDPYKASLFGQMEAIISDAVVFKLEEIANSNLS